MTIPTANELETTFLQAGQIRKRNPKYQNDSTYWEGGRCNWGGNHNLKEDCQSLIKGFGKMESLDNMNQDLPRCTSKSEFDTKKDNYLTKCNESINKLSNNTNNSYAFNICCIWSQDNMGNEIQRFIDQAIRGINGLKDNLNNHHYQDVEEIKRINLEIKKLEQQIRENRQKAMNEKDPTKRARLIALIEEDGKLLIQKQNQLAKIENRLNFNASSYVNDMIRAMKEAIEGKHRPRDELNNNNSGRPPRTHNTDPFTPTNFPNTNLNDSNNNRPRKKEEKDENNNRQMLLIIAAVLIIFLLMNKQSSNEEYY